MDVHFFIRIPKFFVIACKMATECFSRATFSNIAFNETQKAQHTVPPTMLCILLPKFFRFSKAGFELLCMVQRIPLRFAVCLTPPFLSLIADCGAAVAGLQCGKRVIRRPRCRACEQRNIHRIYRKAPGIARE